MNWSKLYACARQVGRIMFVGVMSAVALGFVVIVLVSLVTPRPSARTRDLVENIRYPRLDS